MPKGKTSYKLCDKCNNEISLFAYNRHYKRCNGNKYEKSLESLPPGSTSCRFCGETFTTPSGRGVHEIRCSKNENAKPPVKLEAWNKGLTHELDDRLCYGYKISDSLKGKPGRKHTDESKLNLSIKAKERGFGGVTQSRWIYYKDTVLGSSYELTVAISLDENEIIWEKPKKFNYIDPFGKVRTYTPDFYLPEYDVYLDPKNNFLINNINPSLGFKDSEKIELVSNQNNVKIYIIDKDNLNWLSIKEIISKALLV